MAAVSKLDDFESWLRANGLADEATSATRSIAAGILAVAGKGDATAAHVATGIELARDAGISEIATLERVGALLLAFQAGERPPPIGKPVVAGPVVAEVLPPAHTVAPPPELQISIRSSQPTPRAATAELARIVDAPPPPVSPPKPATRKGPIVATIGALAMIGAVGAWWILRDDGESYAPPPKPPETLSSIPELELPVAFPVGWRVVHARKGSAFVARGSEHQAFFATVPLVSPLAATMAGPALVAVAHDAEQGAAERLVASSARYYSEGCEVAADNLAVCRGTATLAGEVVTLQTYLRVGPRRAVLAMFMAKPSVAEPAAIAAAIVASLGG
jgi:hypothetical protein